MMNFLCVTSMVEELHAIVENSPVKIVLDKSDVHLFGLYRNESSMCAFVCPQHDVSYGCSSVGEGPAYGAVVYGLMRLKPMVLTSSGSRSSTIDLVINAGLCGACGTRLNVGSTVVVDSVQFAGNRAIPIPSYHKYTTGHRKLYIPSGMNYPIASCVTYDRFVTPEDVQDLVSTTPQIVDMELAGIANATRQHGIPTSSIKCVSDVLGQSNQGSFEDNLTSSLHNLGKDFWEFYKSIVHDLVRTR